MNECDNKRPHYCHDGHCGKVGAALLIVGVILGLIVGLSL